MTDQSASSTPPGTMSLADTKLLREIQKLEADATEIRMRIASQTTSGERFKRWLGLWMPLISVVSGGLAILLSVMTFANGLAAQQARQLRFNVSQQFITLTTQLQNSTIGEDERSSATLLLAHYQEFAVPVLVRAIAMPSAQVQDIAEALRLIMEPDAIPTSSSPGLLGFFASMLLPEPPNLEQYVLTALEDKTRRAVAALPDIQESSGAAIDMDIDVEALRTAQRYVEVLGLVAEPRCVESVIALLNSTAEKAGRIDDPGASALVRAVRRALARFPADCTAAP